MNTAYAKVFESLFDGSLRGKPDAILVWVNILTHMRWSVSDIHFRKISDETGLPIERVKTACLFLEQPDSESRSPEEQGRRIVRLDDHREWGWRIVNGEKYRMLGGQDDKTKQLTRKRVEEFRRRKTKAVTLRNVTPTLPPASGSGTGTGSGGNGGTGEGNEQGICVKWEWVMEWLVTVKKNGGDYSESEAKQAWLSLNANGWMWGRNPVTDWRAALECKIQDNRGRRSSKKGTNGAEREGLFNEFGTKEQAEDRKKQELAYLASLKNKK